MIRKVANVRRYLMAVGILYLCLLQAPHARGDFGSCVANASMYLAELDELLSRVEDRLTPYDALNERYLPFHDCETNVFLEVVKRSRFARSIVYHPPTNEYSIYLSSEYVKVGFNYLASEKRSNFKTATWVNK
ncbi:MAG: hypothetical protein ABIO35_03285 [Nitrobacter sp.]